MRKYEILFLFATIIFGTSGVISRFINLSSFFLVASRGIIASIFIFLFIYISGKRINFISIKNNYQRLLISGVLLGLMWIFLYSGYQYSVSITCLINNMAPIFVIILSSIIYKDKLSSKQIMCVAFVLIGVLLVSGIFEGEMIADGHSFIYGFLSLLCFCFNVIINKSFKDVEPLDRTLVQIFISSIVALIFAIIAKQIPSSIDKTSLIFLIILGCLNTAIAYILYYSSIITLPAYKIAIIGYLEPVISIVLGVLVLHEKMTLLGTIGSIVIIVSTCLSEFVGNK